MTDTAFPIYRLSDLLKEPNWLSAPLDTHVFLDMRAGEYAGVGPAPILAGADGSLFWMRDGMLVRDGAPGPCLGDVQRLVASGDALFALAGDTLFQLDAASLQKLDVLLASGVTDIAAAEGGGLWLLRDSGIDQIDHCGRPSGTRLKRVSGASAIAASGPVVAVLFPGQAELRLLGTGLSVTINLKALGVAQPKQLSGGRNGFLIVGVQGLLLLDRDGSLFLHGKWAEDSPPVGVIADGDDLLISFNDGAAIQRRRIRRAAAIGDRVILTPALETETPTGEWLCAEALARLPQGATLSLRWAAVDDAGLRSVVEPLLDNPGMPRREKLRRVQELLDPYWSKNFTYVGEAPQSPAQPANAPLESFGFPLHEAKGQLLWIELTIRRNDSLLSPAIEELTVTPAGDGLMNYLPAIYRGAGDRDKTMRRLVGVLEAFTLGVDAKISRLADRLDPERTEDSWLPSLAAVLGLPFDAALTPKMQRSIVGAAKGILLQRGTIAGLRLIANAMFPDRPINIVDRTEQLAALVLGGGAISGSRIPALLVGPTSRQPRLNARLVLNRTRLCPTDPCDSGLLQAAPEVLVTIPATSREQGLYGAAIQQMLASVVPAGVALRLRWKNWPGGASMDSRETLTSVAAPEPARLNEGPALGLAMIAGRRAPRLRGDGATPAEIRLI